MFHVKTKSVVKTLIKGELIDSKENQLMFPIVKLDRALREIRLNRNLLQMKQTNETDSSIEEMKRTLLNKVMKTQALVDGQAGRVGDLVFFNDGKSFGYII